MRFFAGPTLLLIVNSAICRCRRASSALFQFVPQRYLKTSIVITLTGRWEN